MSESLGSLLRRRLGDEATERLVAPLLGGLFAGDVDRLGVRGDVPRARRVGARFGSLIRGREGRDERDRRARARCSSAARGRRRAAARARRRRRRPAAIDDSNGRRGRGRAARAAGSRTADVGACSRRCRRRSRRRRSATADVVRETWPEAAARSADRCARCSHRRRPARLRRGHGDGAPRRDRVRRPARACADDRSDVPLAEVAGGSRSARAPSSGASSARTGPRTCSTRPTTTSSTAVAAPRRGDCRCPTAPEPPPSSAGRGRCRSTRSDTSAGSTAIERALPPGIVRGRQRVPRGRRRGHRPRARRGGRGVRAHLGEHDRTEPVAMTETVYALYPCFRASPRVPRARRRRRRAGGREPLQGVGRERRPSAARTRRGDSARTRT